MAGRYVLLGLAPARARWFEALAQWTMSASVAAEFVKCVSAEEVRARLVSGRSHSALIVDVTAPSYDRDLVDAAVQQSVPVITVGARAGSSARALGVVGELTPEFTPDDLVDLLSLHCQPVGSGASLPPALEEPSEALWLSPMYTVCGPGGTGASTAAMALAQGLGTDPRLAGGVLLADLARRAEHAVLHDVLDLGPGLQELVEDHRVGQPGTDHVRRLTFNVPARGYHLLLGLRQPEAWSALRPRAVDAAIRSLRRTFQLVVADVTGDFEGEAQGGSADVEERNHPARTAAVHSTVTVVVGSPGLKGVHSLAGLIRSLVDTGVSPDRLLAVINRSPRHPRTRAESARALASLLEPAGIRLALSGPVHVPERKVDDAIRDGSPLPAQLVDPLVGAVEAVARKAADLSPPVSQPLRIEPGSLGAWSDTEMEPGTF